MDDKKLKCSKCKSAKNTGWVRYVFKGGELFGVNFRKWSRIKCLDCGHELYRGRPK